VVFHRSSGDRASSDDKGEDGFRLDTPGADGRIVAEIHQIVRDLKGALISDRDVGSSPANAKSRR
jgi:hypothetical protein